MNAIIRALGQLQAVGLALSHQETVTAADAAYREFTDILSVLRAAEMTITALCPHIEGLTDHPTLVTVRAAIAKAEGRS